MYIGQKIIKRAPFRWGIVGGGSTSNVGYKHRLGAAWALCATTHPSS